MTNQGSHPPHDGEHRAKDCALCAPLRHPSQRNTRAGLAAHLPRQTRKGGR